MMRSTIMLRNNFPLFSTLPKIPAILGRFPVTAITIRW